MKTKEKTEARKGTRRCPACNKKMQARTARTNEGVPYQYYRCACGEEILDMQQLHNVAEAYRRLKQYHVKVSRWGGSLGIRIPKELARHYQFKDDAEVTLIPEEDGVRLLSE